MATYPTRKVFRIGLVKYNPYKKTFRVRYVYHHLVLARRSEHVIMRAAPRTDACMRLSSAISTARFLLIRGAHAQTREGSICAPVAAAMRNNFIFFAC